MSEQRAEKACHLIQQVAGGGPVPAEDGAAAIEAGDGGASGGGPALAVPNPGVAAVQAAETTRRRALQKWHADAARTGRRGEPASIRIDRRHYDSIRERKVRR